MSEMRLAVFDRALTTAHTWVSDVARAIGTDDRRFAYRVLRAWLHTLRDRLTVDGAAHFAAQLPELLRGVFYDGWEPSRVPVRYGIDEYTRRFAEQARIPAGDVPRMAATVTYAVGAHLSPGQLAGALAQLPHKLRGLLLGSVAAAQAGTRTSSATSPGTRLTRLILPEVPVAGPAETSRVLDRSVEEIPSPAPAHPPIRVAAG